MLRGAHETAPASQRDGVCPPIAARALGTADGCQTAKSARCRLPIGTPCEGSNQQATLAGLIKP